MYFRNIALLVVSITPQLQAQCMSCCVCIYFRNNDIILKKLSYLATYDALSLVNHKAQLPLAWVHMVDICTVLINSW